MPNVFDVIVLLPIMSSEANNSKRGQKVNTTSKDSALTMKFRLIRHPRQMARYISVEQCKQGLAWKEVDLNIAGPLSELTVGMAGALMHCPWKSNPTG
ncbi:hypothetical protein T4D_9127 [Trichinella pseudospiralis]|uniref:Uncharacterized protein n=1 Tax=Trichinella pseudospiralis TaxID=6337 RepID=A0A0V1G2C1_TRIPS|nr:hypothetical protein T4D_9127 [Trichinella pseudospiralis]